MSRVGLAMLFDRAGGSLTEAIRDEIEKVELKKPHHQLLIAKVRKRWDTWNLREDQQGDDCLEYDSFYNGLTAPYLSYHDAVIQREEPKLFIWILMADVETKR